MWSGAFFLSLIKLLLPLLFSRFLSSYIFFPFFPPSLSLSLSLFFNSVSRFAFRVPVPPTWFVQPADGSLRPFLTFHQSTYTYSLLPRALAPLTHPSRPSLRRFLYLPTTTTTSTTTMTTTTTTTLTETRAATRLVHGTRIMEVFSAKVKLSG